MAMTNGLNRTEKREAGSMSRYDIAIVGTGPAGVSAAITAKIRNKSLILIGKKQLSDKLFKAERIDNYPGFPGISGKALAGKLKEHLASLGIDITEKRVSGIYTMPEHFILQAGEDLIEAESVILAGGIQQGKPLPGEESFIGRGVSYCATCDGRLYQRKKVIVLEESEDAVSETAYLAGMAESVRYFSCRCFSPAWAEERRKAFRAFENVEVVEEKPEAIRGSFKAEYLVTDKGEYAFDGIFILRDAVKPETLVPGIETEGPHIRTNSDMETNIPGIFVCGDIAGKPYQYIKAAGQGNIAALSAVRYLADKV